MKTVQELMAEYTALNSNEPSITERDIFADLSESIRKFNPQIKFRMLEIGAADVGHQEPFYRILELFPGSEIIGFELDAAVCVQMNSDAPEGIKYFPFALGEKNENRILYETNHPMCTSLYKPNEELLRLYNNFEVGYVKDVKNIDTVSLNYFAKEHSIGTIDFIKIDVEGAELEIFKGGGDVLPNVLAMVSEVEFIQHHEKQPLFGDICTFLTNYELMFHKFLGFGGRALRPIVLAGDVSMKSQDIWADTLFIRDVLKISNLKSEQLLKLSVLALIYNSLDLSYYCLNIHDTQHKTNLAKLVLSEPPIAVLSSYRD
jgi:FkbM family methyltransferase